MNIAAVDHKPADGLDLKGMANAVRALSMDAVEKAKSGHPGMPMGMADVAAVLFAKFMKVDPANPHWPDRDRFVLSAGHGSMLLYSIHHLLGFSDMGIDQLKNFRQLGSPTAGHPDRDGQPTRRSRATRATPSGRLATWPPSSRTRNPDGCSPGRRLCSSPWRRLRSALSPCGRCSARCPRAASIT